MRSERELLLEVLTEMETALEDNIERSIAVRDRVRWFRDELLSGASVTAAVADEPEPRAVELLTSNIAVLDTVGARFRANLAHALRDEGLTIESIADLYGVTRQRISALLRQNRAHD